MSYDVGEEQSVKTRKSKLQIQRERELEEFRQMLQTKQARYWVWKLLSYCGVFDSLSVADPHSMALRSGARDIGLRVFKELCEVDPKLFYVMQTEAKERETNG